MPEPITPTPTLQSVLHPRRHRRVLAVLAAGGLAAAGLVGARGAWVDTVARDQTNTVGAVDFVLVDPSGGSLTTTFGPFVPGDSGTRYVGVRSSGGIGTVTLEASFGDVTDTSTDQGEAVLSDITDNVTVTVEVCPAGWSSATAATCPGAGWQPAAALSSITLAELAGGAYDLSEAVPTDTDPVGVALTMTVNSETPAAVMGSSVPITWSFTAAQRSPVGNK